MNRVIIGLGYKMQHGKDTVADYLVNNHDFVKVRFADKLKDIVAEIYGWDRDLLDDADFKNTYDPYWDTTPRKALQTTGQAMRDNVRSDIWVKALMRSVDQMDDDRVVIPDMRYINEAEAIKRAGGVAIHVDRGEYRAQVDDMSVHEHESETQLDGYDGFDLIIHNNRGLAELYDVSDRLAAICTGFRIERPFKDYQLDQVIKS